MTALPRLTIGLPVHNGEVHLAESFDALLGQTYGDFSLVVSDNASTDGTGEICREYASRDPRITYIRQVRNIGAAPNHNLLVAMTTTELFKWASHDDLYARDLLTRCVAALDAYPHVVLAHAEQAVIDSDRRVTHVVRYPHRTGSRAPSERYRSMLFEPGGDDFYGVLRTDVLSKVTPHGSHHHADRTFMAELSLFGAFHQVPEILYFRRDHPARAERANPTPAARCANLDPRRAGQSDARLRAECALGFLHGIRRAPLSSAERRRCLAALASWGVARMRPRPGGGLWSPAHGDELASLVRRTVAGAASRPGYAGVPPTADVCATSEGETR